MLTARALIAGFLLALLLCAVNSYLTLSFGVIEEGPTIAALLFFAVFFVSRNKILTSEMVIVATMGSAGGSLGFISNFYAAQAMVSTPYSLWQMVGFAVVTSLVGLVFVVPLRDLLILREKLPWPGSKATAGVIEALVHKGDPKQPRYLVATIVLAMAYVVANKDGGFGLVPDQTEIALFGLSAFGVAIAWSPFAIGGAYLMGMRTCVGFLLGAVVLYLMAPHTPVPAAPHRYVWPGIGFLVASGLAQMAVNWRVLAGSLRSLLSLREKTDDDDPVISGKKLIAFAAAAFSVTALFSWLALGLNVVLVLVLIIVGGFLQNVIATRAAAQTAFNPARAFGPAIVSGDLHGQIVYWAGPLLGAVIAGLLWKLVLLPRDPTDL